MKRWLKWAGVVAVAAITGLIVLYVFFSAGYVKRLAEAKAGALIGREVRLERLSIGIFGIEARGLTVAAHSEKSGKKSPLLRAERVRAQINPLALFYKRVSILHLILDGALLEASRDDRGRFSFDDIIQRFRSQSKKTAEPPGPPSGTSLGPKEQATETPTSDETEKAGFDVVIHKMDIDELTLKLHSAQLGERPAFRTHCLIEHLEVEAIQLGEPFDVILDGGCTQPGKVRFKTKASLNPAKNTYQVSADLAPFDLVPFLMLMPLHKELQILDGKGGGKINARITEKGILAWESDLQGEKFEAEFFPPEKEKRSVAIKEWGLRSKGQWDLGRQAVRFDTLRIKVPFGELSLTKPAFWNDSGKDAIHVNLNLTDPGTAAKLTASFLRIPIQIQEQKGQFTLSISAIRNRTKEKDFNFEGSANFDSLGLETFLDLLPENGWWKETKGKVGGKVVAGFSSKKVFEWRSDLMASDLITKGWRKASVETPLVRLPPIKLQTEGAFDSKTSSAEVTRFELDLPFARMHLLNKVRWNVSGQDEIKAQLHVSDTAKLSELVSNLAGLSIKGFKKGTEAKLTLKGSRNRKESQNFSVEVSGSFEPLAIGPFAGFFSLPPGVQKLQGEVEGDVSAFLSEGQDIRWEIDLKGRNARAEVQPSPKEKWRPLSVSHLHFRSKGRYRLSLESAEMSFFKLELPFGNVRLLENALWNVSGRDDAKVQMNITDVSAFRRVAGPLTGFSFQEGKNKEKLSLRVSAHRDRTHSDQFGFTASSSFLPIEIAPFAQLLPFPEYLRKIEGTTGGKLELSLSPEKVVRWNLNLRGKSLSADVRPNQEGKWKHARLKSTTIQTGGWYHPETESGEVTNFTLNLPFAKVDLPQKASWNIKGQDKARILLAIENLNDAEQWASSIVDLPIALDQKIEKLAASLVLARSRKDEDAFSYHLSTAFDPFEIAPLARLVSFPPFIQDPAGQVAGRLELSFSASKKISWNISLQGEEVRANLRPTEKEEWNEIALGRVQFDSKGAYDLALNSGIVSKMDIALPFGKIHLLKEARWNDVGQDEVAFTWDINNLEKATETFAEVASPFISGLTAKGNGKGTVIFHRNRKLSNVFRARGKGKTHLTRLHFGDYPNLEIQGQISGEFKETTLELSLPKVVVRDRSHPDSQPAIALNDFEATISQRELWQGQIAVERAFVKSLTIRVFMDPENYSTFDTLFEPKSRQPDKQKVGVQEIVAKSSNKTEVGRTDKAASIQSSKEKGLLPERPSEFLPAIKMKRLEIKRVDFHFKHKIEKNLEPFATERKNLNLLVENFDTRMKPHLMETRLKIIGPGQPPRIQLRAKLNPGVTPLKAKGVILGHQQELRPFSPYAYHTRGVEIRGGKANAEGTFSLQKNKLQMKVKAKLFGLDVRSTKRRGLVREVSRAAENVALDLLRRRGGNLTVNFEMKERVDAPDFNYYEDLTEGILLSVFTTLLNLPGWTMSLGGKATDFFRNIIEGVLPESSP